MEPLRLQSFIRLFSKDDYDLYRQGEDFAVYRKRNDEAIEYVEMTGESQAHLHTEQSSVFVFLTPGKLILGGMSADGDKTGYVSRMNAMLKFPYPVPRYVLHAAGPLNEGDTVQLLIFNELARPRTESEYTDDTVFPEMVIFTD